MAKLGINTGTTPNDGTGDTLLSGAVKINANFNEIYSTFGDGTNLTSAGLTSTSNINTTGVITATAFYGDGSGLTNLPGGVGGGSTTLNDLTDVTLAGISSGQVLRYDGATNQWINSTISGISTYVPIAGVSTYASTAGVSTYAITSGVATYSSTAGVSTYAGTSGISTVAQGLAGTPNITVGSVTANSINSSGIITASSFSGSGANLTGVASTNFVTSSIASIKINDLSDVNAGAPSTGQVLKWSGTEWEAASDLTAAGGTGIGLSDLSVTINPAGINSLTYNNTTGVFLFTPTSLVGYATTGYVTTQIGLNTFTGAATTITAGQISNWNTAYGWGNHASVGYLTNVNITAGSNISVLETSEGNFIITSTSVAGSGTTWSTNASGIHTTKNVGIGTTLSTSALTVEGNGRFSGIVTASRFESTSAGTPTIDSPNNLNINATTVAISTDVTIGDELRVAGITTISPGGIRVAGVVTAQSFIGNLTGTASTATAAATAYTLVGTVSTASFATTSFGLTGTPNITVGNISASQINVSGVSTFTNVVSFGTSAYFGDNETLYFGDNNDLYILHNGSISAIADVGTGDLYLANDNALLITNAAYTENKAIFNSNSSVELYYDNVKEFETTGYGATVYGTLQSQQLNVSGISTSLSFRSNSTTGDGSDVGFAIKYYITASGFSAYRFAGPGLVNTTDNPTLYLHRGFTYIFENSTGGSHPFRIQFTGTTTGVGTYVSGSQTGTQVFTIPFDAPASYQYQCTVHAGMIGTFNVVS